MNLQVSTSCPAARRSSRHTSTAVSAATWVSGKRSGGKENQDVRTQQEEEMAKDQTRNKEKRPMLEGAVGLMRDLEDLVLPHLTRMSKAGDFLLEGHRRLQRLG